MDSDKRDWRDREQRETAHENEWEPRGHHPILTAACIVLAIAVVGLAWYSYPRFKQQDASFTQLRDEMRDRVRDLKDRASDSSSVHDRLRNEAEKIRQDLRARIDAAGKRATQAAEDTYNRLEARMNAETQAHTQVLNGLNDRVTTLEASRAADQTQLAGLKQELNDARARGEERAGQLGEQQAQALDELRQQMTDSQSGARDQIDALRRDTEQNRRDVAGIAGKLAVEKVPFEASTDRQTDVASGISLYLSGTDVSYRRASGWLWLASEHRNIWVRQQSALEPLVFYGLQDGQKRELVFTNVARNSVTGYLLLPKQAD